MKLDAGDGSLLDRCDDTTTVLCDGDDNPIVRRFNGIAVRKVDILAVEALDDFAEKLVLNVTDCDLLKLRHVAGSWAFFVIALVQLTMFCTIFTLFCLVALM